MIGSWPHDSIRLRCMYLHLCCSGFLFVLSAAKELHRRCKLFLYLFTYCLWVTVLYSRCYIAEQCWVQVIGPLVLWYCFLIPPKYLISSRGSSTVLHYIILHKPSGPDSLTWPLGALRLYMACIVATVQGSMIWVTRKPYGCGCFAAASRRLPGAARCTHTQHSVLKLSFSSQRWPLWT